MTDDVRALLDRAAPAAVTELDLPRALHEGRRHAHRKTAATAMSTLAVAGVIATTVAGWPLGQRVAVDPSPFTSGVAADLVAAGCTPVATGNPTSPDHFDPADAPAAEAIYDVPLPSAGPHLSRFSPTPATMSDAALDVRAVVHNLEHGAVAVWVDTDRVAPEMVDAIEQWAAGLHADGFVNNNTGGSIMISPTPPDLAVAPISVRAWGTALDCQAWSPDVADAFVAEHFGTRGRAPEGNMAPYPNPDPLADLPR